jgi:outer membrane protein OmpA-like peptidoglycan-associated protein/tetratricopeptide (TPR) repeat protein
MNRHLQLVLALLIAFPFFCQGQQQQRALTKSKKAIDNYNLALRSFSTNQYGLAEQQLITAINEDTNFIDAYLVLAEVYEDWKKPRNAIEVYHRALPIDEKYYPYGYVRLGNLEYKEGLYENAKSSYSRFLNLELKNTLQIEKAKSGIIRCDYAIELMKHPVEFKPVNLGPRVNSPGDDYWPSLSADEKTLVITRLVRSEEFMKNFQEDFYISHWNDSAWTYMENAGKPLNTSDNEGAQSITGDGRFMVFTACNRSDGLGRCDLYASEKEGDKWKTPYNLGSPVNSKFRETQPSLTPDGRTLYFSSDRPGGKGQHDIWVTSLGEDGKWTEPKNLGDTINTDGIEMSPFIHQDNQSLYYSSDGLPGLGGYDLFVSKKDSNGRWQKPVNMGYPINTNRDEIGLIVNSKGDKAYYASDMSGNAGKDIYVFEMPLQLRPLTVTYMKGKVFDALTYKPLKADFQLIDLETGKMAFNAYSDSVTGEFLVSIPVNRNYLLNVSRQSYLFYSENFALLNVFNPDKPFLKDVPLQPLVAGSTVILKNVFFETDSYLLRDESKIELNKVVKMLKDNPSIRIEIGGHTDNTGTADHNQQLSENRAKSVAEYLISSSINAGRILWKGYGFNVPVASNDTPEGRAQNRRTEMKIVK